MSQMVANRNITRRALLAGLGGAAAMGALAACGGGPTGTSAPPAEDLKPEVDGDLTWFTWEDYVEPTIVSDFETKYGVKVETVPFDSNDTMLQKLAAGLPYDLITANSAYMTQAIEGGLVRPFTLESLGNGGEVLEYFHKPIYENAGDLHSLPYSGGPTGIVYRTDKMQPTNSWNDLWDNESAAGHIYLLDYQLDTIGASLLRDGADLNSEDDAAVAKAIDSLLTLKPLLGGVSNDTRTNVGNGDAWIHHTWVPDAFYLMSESRFADRLAFELTTEEGVPFGMDLLTVGANAKSPGTAMLFMDWVISPEMSSRNAHFTAQLTGTTSGDVAYREATAEFPTLAVGDDYYQSALWRESATGARKQLWTQQWNRFKAS